MIQQTDSGHTSKIIKSGFPIITCMPCSQMKLLMASKAKEQPKCPSVAEWMNRRWYIHTKEYSSTLRRKDGVMPQRVHSETGTASSGFRM